MPVFNAMPYLQSSIDSVLNQTLDDAYLLIVDDGSVDGSYEYVKGVRDRRVRVMLQPHKGPGAAMNAALEHVETQYLARMDADDIAMPTRLEKQVALLEAHPEVLACSCNSYYINRAGQIIGSSTVPICHVSSGNIARLLTRSRLSQ
jgi:glycosyltransferase involved in cell wall biosynthesis